MNKQIFIFLFLLAGLNAIAQDTTQVATDLKDTITTASPAAETVITPDFLRVDLGFDYLKLGTLAFHNEDKYEGIAAINFGFGLSLDGEYGYTRKSPPNLYKNGTYTVEGNYYRIGLGYNMILGENNIFGLGIRYARSEFEDQTKYTILSDAFEDLNYFKTKSLNAQWAELVIKTEGPVKKLKNLKLGMFIRIKFLDPIKDHPDFELYPVQLIPGYGVAKANTTAAVNLYIKYSIPIIK